MATTGTLKQLTQSGTISQQRTISSTSQLTAPSIQRFSGMVELLTPPPSLDDLDINQGMVVDILLRLTYNEGEVSATHAEEVVKLPYRIIDDLLAWMQQEHMLEVAKAVGSLGRRGYVYNLTDLGRSRAKEAFERTQYVGPAPVPLEKYTKSVLAQATIEKLSRSQVQQALSEQSDLERDYRLWEYSNA